MGTVVPEVRAEDLVVLVTFCLALLDIHRVGGLHDLEDSLMETSIWTEEDWTQEKLRFSEVCLHLDRHFQFRQRDHLEVSAVAWDEEAEVEVDVVMVVVVVVAGWRPGVVEGCCCCCRRRLG